MGRGAGVRSHCVEAFGGEVRRTKMGKDSVLSKPGSKNRLGHGRLSSGQDIAPQILETIPATLNVVDVHYNVLAIGGNILRTSESPDKIIGKKCHQVFQKRDKPCPWCKIGQVIKTGEVVNEMTTPGDPREKITRTPLNEREGWPYHWRIRVSYRYQSYSKSRQRPKEGTGIAGPKRAEDTSAS